MDSEVDLKAAPSVENLLRPNPFSKWTDPVQQSLLKKGLLCFPSIILDKKGIKKGLIRPTGHNNFYCTNMSDPAIVPRAVKISNQLPSQEGSVNKKYTGTGSPIIQKWTLTLAVWLITSNRYVRRVFHDKLARLSRIYEDKTLNQISNQPGISLVDVIDETLMDFNVL